MVVYKPDGITGQPRENESYDRSHCFYQRKHFFYKKVFLGKRLKRFTETKHNHAGKKRTDEDHLKRYGQHPAQKRP